MKKTLFILCIVLSGCSKSVVDLKKIDSIAVSKEVSYNKTEMLKSWNIESKERSGITIESADEINIDKDGSVSAKGAKGLRQYKASSNNSKGKEHLKSDSGRNIKKSLNYHIKNKQAERSGISPIKSSLILLGSIIGLILALFSISRIRPVRMFLLSFLSKLRKLGF